MGFAKEFFLAFEKTVGIYFCSCVVVTFFRFVDKFVGDAGILLEQFDVYLLSDRNFS